jgi:hypothetical protein
VPTIRVKVKRLAISRARGEFGLNGEFGIYPFPFRFSIIRD